MKKSLLVSSLLFAGSLMLPLHSAHAEGFARGRSVHTNPAGGVSGKFASGVKGPNGGMAGGAHRFATDGEGNAAGGSASGARRLGVAGAA